MRVLNWCMPFSVADEVGLVGWLFFADGFLLPFDQQSAIFSFDRICHYSDNAFLSCHFRLFYKV